MFKSLVLRIKKSTYKQIRALTTFKAYLFLRNIQQKSKDNFSQNKF